MKHARIAPLFLALALSAPAAFETPDLKPHTLEAFLRYARITEAEFLRQVQSDEFLRIDTPGGIEKLDEAWEAINAGDVYIEKLKMLDGGEEVEVKNGIVHHWYGGVFVEGATLDQVLEMVQDYDTHSTVFAPDVEDSAINDVNPAGDEFDIRYRFRKKKVITVVLETEHHVEYTEVSANRAYSMSRTTKVQEVEHPGERNEQLKLPDTGRGFVWRINSYWRFDQRDEGTFIECESITLTRNIPLLLKPIVSPFVSGVPKETLTHTLQSARDELVRRASLPGGEAQHRP